MDPHLGDGIKPEEPLLVEALAAVEWQAVEKIALDRSHRRFHAAFRLRLSRRTGLDLKVRMVWPIITASIPDAATARLGRGPGGWILWRDRRPTFQPAVRLLPTRRIQGATLTTGD